MTATSHLPRVLTDAGRAPVNEVTFRAIVEQCASCIIIQCGEQIVYANSAAIDCLGLPPMDEIRGTALGDLFEPDSYATLAPNLRKVTPEDDQLFMGELQLRRRAGDLVHAEVYHVAI